MLRLSLLLFRIAPVGATLSTLFGALSVGGALAVLLSIRALATSETLRPGPLILLAIGAIAALAARSASQWSLLGLSKLAMRRLAEDCSARMLATTASNLERIGPRRIQTAMLSDAPAIAQALYALPTIGAGAAILVGCLILLQRTAPLVLLIFVGWLVIEAAALAISLYRSRHRLTEPQDESRGPGAQFRRLIEGFKELKMRRTLRSAFVERSLLPAVEEGRSSRMAGQEALVVANGVGRVWFLAAVGVTLLGLPRWGGVDPSMAGMCVLILLFAAGPVESLRQQAPVVMRGSAALKRRSRLEQELARVSEPPASAAMERWPRPDWKEIVLDRAEILMPRKRDEEGGVDAPFAAVDRERDFSADPGLGVDAIGEGAASDSPAGNGPGPTLLGPWSLVVRRGETIAIDVESRDASARFARLLAGVDAPIRGTLGVDGGEIVAERRDNYRQLFSAIFHDARSFAEVQPVRITPLVESVRGWLGPFGLEGTARLENGALHPTRRMNASERRRFVLLDSLLDDRTAYLFDDFASGQPEETARTFRDAILPDLKARGKTAIVLTSDPSPIPTADRRGTLSADFLSFEDVVEPATAAPAAPPLEAAT